MKKKTTPEAPEWFQAHEERQNAFNTEVIKRLDKIETRLDNLEKDVAAIKECPTIKKELEKK